MKISDKNKSIKNLFKIIKYVTIRKKCNKLNFKQFSTTEENITSISIGLDQSTSTENYLDQLKKANNELAKNKEINVLAKEQLKEVNSQCPSFTEACEESFFISCFYY